MRPVVIVIDSAPYHSRIEEILNEEEFKRNKILRLAPYNPMLNPIEQVWSVVKANVKGNLAENAYQMFDNDLTKHLSVREFRLQSLKDLFKKQ